MYLLLEDCDLATLLDWFKNNDYFSEILDHLLSKANNEAPSNRETKKARQRKPGNRKFTVDVLTKVANLIAKLKTFMADGGSHFNCDKVRNWCKSNGIHPLMTPAYTPWTNRLTKGSIKLLIGCLKKLCSLSVGESLDTNNNAASTPTAWPKHLTTAVLQLNNRDTYTNALWHTDKRKQAFDKRVWVVDYAPGDLVQKYDA
ncbi:hypothetical protein FRC07_001572 [Ceratobasidium sp. 392]|nr:hypothetical protein FRC07_001572 [Ceratobasidium sp. 392]